MPRLLAIVAVLALSAAGCGQAASSADDFEGEEQCVAEVVEDLQDAGSRRDAGRICDELLAKTLIDEIKQASKTTCDDALEDRLADTDAFELQVKRVAITGDRATATVSSEAGDQKRTDTLQLQRVDGAWKIATLG